MIFLSLKRSIFPILHVGPGFCEATPGSTEAAVSSFRKGIKLSIRMRVDSTGFGKIKKVSAAGHNVADLSGGLLPSSVIQQIIHVNIIHTRGAREQRVAACGL